MAFKSFDELRNFIFENKTAKFKIKVIPSSKDNSVEFTDEFIKVKIREKAIEGRANKAVIEFFSNALDIPKSKISISSGHKSSFKLIEVNL